MNGMLFLKQRLRELFRVEGLQVVRLLAEADEFDGQCRGAMGIAGGCRGAMGIAGGCGA
jgi:hypothetical protein